MRTYTDAKAIAKSLRGCLAARSVALSHAECLEIVAKQFGFADWNTFSAKLNADSGGLVRAEDPATALQPAKSDAVSELLRDAAPEQLSCSFCGRSRHEVLSLIEGGCGNRGKSSCVFICDECVAFCAQINAQEGDAHGFQECR